MAAVDTEAAAAEVSEEAAPGNPEAEVVLEAAATAVNIKQKAIVKTNAKRLLCFGWFIGGGGSIWKSGGGGGFGGGGGGGYGGT